MTHTFKIKCIASIIFMGILITATAIIAQITSITAQAQPAAGGVSAKQAEVDRLKNEIASINTAGQEAVERYNQAFSELENIKKKQVENEAAIGEASIKLKEARVGLEERLVNIYRDGSLSILDVMLNTSSFDEFVTRFDMLGRIGQQDRDVIDKYFQYKAETEKLQAELETSRQRQERLVSDLASEKSQIESQLAARQAVLSGTQGEVAQILSQQAQPQPGAAGSNSLAAPVSAPANGTGNTSQPSAPASQPSEPDPGESSPDPAPSPSPPPATATSAASIAQQYLGVPYVWGGASPSGFDCSGLVMYVYAQIGIYLPHSAAAQYSAGTPISDSERQPGDLVFFGSPISHVGIYVGGGTMIHAPFEGSVVSYGGVGGPSYVGAIRL